MSQPNTTRHHADWLSLVEVSGPFVSLPVIQRVFSHGLDPRDPAQAKALRASYDEWQDNPTAPGKQHTWVMHVLTNLLGYPAGLLAEGQRIPAGTEANMPEMSETLRPDFALLAPGGGDTTGPAQLLIASYPNSQSLDKPVIGKHWKATPATRMMELLHGTGVPLGLVTNGEHWMMVYAPRGETTGYASWYGALWLDEPITLRAFHSLLGVRRFFGVSADNTLLALLKESASDQQEVTDQLGYQVREAVEVLVQSFDALDKESNRTLLKGVSPSDQYDASLTVMMRLVFLFSAEERGMLHLGKPLYDDNYAVSTLQEQLQEVADQHGEEVLERRYDAWARLLATFRAIHGGIHHQDLMMQAYGGSLFNPDRYPFLEGRPAGSIWRNTSADTLAVNNRVVLHLLNSLQRLRLKTGGTAETRRVSFRALGVEQIGHVYEGLLDHTAVLANEPVLGIIGTRKKEPEIPLATLESIHAQGQDKLFEYLKEETGKSVSALRKAFEGGSLLDEHKFLLACEQDESLSARIRPFAGLIREDSFDRPLVVVPGSVYVTAGTTRRSTGTHYTPPSLTEPIVQHTLEPLVYEGPAEGWPREQWKLRSPKEILNLRICDMAMGSGAFLVQVCRYLAERLVEAWENEEKKHPGEVLITPEGKFSAGAPSERLVPVDANERIAIARRVVADRCLYGVDINPMAVEMAKLSLWLITMDANRPFTFLDHAFKCGDSLLGITSLEQLENFSLRPGGGKQQAFATLNLWRHIDEAKKKREELEAMPSDTPEQVAAKVALYDEAEDAVAKLNAAADVLVAVELKGLKGKTYESERESSADHMMAYWAKELHEFQGYARQRLAGRNCFHWVLAFPEIIGRGGFDAFVGNPPFLGGLKITEINGDDYGDYLALMFNGNNKVDLCAFFFKRSYNLLAEKGAQGLLATNTISQGVTRKHGLTDLISSGASIYSALPNVQWPGQASVFVTVTHIYKGKWDGVYLLDNKRVGYINDLLIGAEHSKAQPEKLNQNSGLCFQGSNPLGEGFFLDVESAKIILSIDKKYAEVVRPVLGGKELNQLIDNDFKRWIIDFGERSESDARQYPAAYEHVLRNVKSERETKDGEKYPRMVNEWWKFWHSRNSLYEGMHRRNLGRVLVRARVSDYHIFEFLPTSMTYTEQLAVFLLSEWSDFAVLQSSLHEIWARQYASSLGNGMRYIPGDCFETFPFPNHLAELSGIGEQLWNIRATYSISHNVGLYDIYKLMHNPEVFDKEIAELRNLHMQVDSVLLRIYGMDSIALNHGFHNMANSGVEKTRFTISQSARREVLDRLLALNHQRHAEEEAERAAQVAAAPAKRTRKKKDAGDQIAMDI